MNSTSASTLKRDPVCGMTVHPATAKAKAEHAGETYFFCCSGCAQKFLAHPEEYLKPRSSAAGLVTLGTKQVQVAPTSTAPHTNSAQDMYVCPMCAEVRESKPGPCPSCGMALEPERPKALTKTEYVCPMHPQIVRSEPGNCPICGMTLEPGVVSAGEPASAELADMTRRFWISVALTMPLILIEMSHMIPGQSLQRVSPASLRTW